MRIDYEWLRSVDSFDAQCYDFGFALLCNLFRIFNYPNGKWRIQLSVEYRGYHGKYYG